MAKVLLPESKLNITAVSVSHDYFFFTLNDGINDQIRQYDVRSEKWPDVPLSLTGTAHYSA